MSDRKLKPDPLSRANLIAWLSEQPADRSYLFPMPNLCMLGVWARSIDPKAHSPYGGFEYLINGELVNLLHFCAIAKGNGWETWTYGAALERARNA